MNVEAMSKGDEEKNKVLKCANASFKVGGGFNDRLIICSITNSICVCSARVGSSSDHKLTANFHRCPGYKAVEGGK